MGWEAHGTRRAAVSASAAPAPPEARENVTLSVAADFCGCTSSASGLFCDAPSRSKTHSGDGAPPASGYSASNSRPGPCRSDEYWILGATAGRVVGIL